MEFSRSLKRLVMIVVLAIIVILVSKSLLSKAAKNLSLEAEKKQQANMLKPAAIPAESAPVDEISSAPALAESIELPMQSSPAATDSPVSIAPSH